MLCKVGVQFGGQQGRQVGRGWMGLQGEESSMNRKHFCSEKNHCCLSGREQGARSQASAPFGERSAARQPERTKEAG